jgi:putative ABC transport system ATP-binding protein
VNKKQTLIEFKNIFLKFGEKVILENFNLKILTEDKIVIIGPSGIGKSSLFNLVLGLKQAQSGGIFFKNKKINPQNIQFLRSQIAYVDQDNSLGTGSVKEIIEDYFSFEVNTNKILNEDQLKKMISDFSLDSDILKKNINQLSGGEKQRVSLIIALLLDRPILLLDEISSALDPKLVGGVINKILELKNKTIIVVAHDTEWQKQKNIRIFDFKEKKWKQ